MLADRRVAGVAGWVMRAVALDPVAGCVALGGIHEVSLFFFQHLRGDLSPNN